MKYETPRYILIILGIHAHLNQNGSIFEKITLFHMAMLLLLLVATCFLAFLQFLKVNLPGFIFYFIFLLPT